MTITDHLRVVLVSPRNPLNIGAAARAMANFGFERLRVVNPYEIAFREARSAVGASNVLQRAEEYSNLPEAIADCALVVGTTAASHRVLEQPLRRLETVAKLIRLEAAAGPLALLFGSEKFGLSNADLSHCHWLIRIPTVDPQPSMNLGQAVAVCLYELVRSPERAAARAGGRKSATSGDLERLTEMLFAALRLSGYVNIRTAASTGLKLRRMLRRLNLTAADAVVWLGMLRQILWKLNENRESR